MIGLIIDQFLKGNALRDTVVRYSFFSFNGLLAGVFLHDLLRILFAKVDEKYEYGLGAATLASGHVIPELAIFGDANNNTFLGGGMLVGTFWSAQTEKKIPIKITDARPKEKVSND